MAWTESDRVQIRYYLGMSSTFTQLDARLESAITVVQAQSDGGQRPDNSTELQMRAVIAQLQSIDTSINNLALGGSATHADEVQLNAARETARLRMVGRMYVGRLARFLDTLPYSDVFSAAPSRATGYPTWPLHGRNPYMP